MYVLTEENKLKEYPYSIRELRRDNPQTSFPKNLSNELLAEWGVYPVTLADRPEFDRITQKLVEAEPVKLEGQWIRAWTVVNLDKKAIAKNRKDQVPRYVSRFQARMALRQAGLFEAVESMMSAPGAPIEAVEAWDSAQVFMRTSPTIETMRQELNMTEEQLDELFIAADQIEA